MAGPTLKVSEIREKFPMYADMSDDDLLMGLHARYYSDMPVGKFLGSIERDTEAANMRKQMVAGMPWYEKAAVGYGKAIADVGQGVGQLFGRVSNQDVADTRRLSAEVMDTGAAQAGSVLSNVAMLAPTALIPGAATVRGAALIGGTAGLLQPATSTGERAKNTAFGAGFGAAGQGLANQIGKVAANSTSQLTQGQQAAAAAGKTIGMRQTPGQASGSRALQQMEAGMESNPMTSAGFSAIKETNQKAVNRAAAKAIGETADELSTPVLAQAERRIGAVFDAVADQTPVPLDPIQVGGKLRQIAQDSDGMLMGNADLTQNGLWKRLDDFVNNRGGASREQLRQLSSNLGKAARQNMTTQNGDRGLGEALFAAQEVVEDAIQGTLNQQQQAAYKAAREQYRNLLALTAKTNVTNPSSGNVSARGLATTLMQKDRGGFTMGGNNTDMYAAARFAQAFPSIVGDSGTATRSIGPTDYLTGLPGNVLMRMYLSQPVAAAAGAGGGAAGTAARLLNRQPINQLMAPTSTALGLFGANALQK